MRKEHKTLFLSALEEHQEKLFRVCLMYSKDREDAKDLFQEVLIHVWRSMPSFKGNASLSTWMFRITLNVCLRFKTKHTKNQHRFIRLDSMTIANFGSETQSGGENEKLMHLRACVKKLRDADKAIVSLYLEGVPYREISNILGISENNVAVKVKRIKLKLLNCINSIL